MLPLAEIYDAMLAIENQVGYDSLAEGNPMKKFIAYVKRTWTDSNAMFPRAMVSGCKARDVGTTGQPRG